MSSEADAGTTRVPGGVVVLGAHYGALGLVRSLGRRGIASVVIKRDEHVVASFSRYAKRVLEFPPGELEAAFLLDIGNTYNLHGWLLMPTTDETVALVARSAEQLGQRYIVMTSPWSTIERLCDKRSLYQLAKALSIDCPLTFCPKSRDALSDFDCEFPVIIKPAHREATNPLTRDKAWQVNNHRELLARYEEAARFMDPELIMVQEVISGSGETQFSYAALCSEGDVLASVSARRTRQFPMTYGRASSYVETITPEAAMESSSVRLLTATRITGLVEVEFKRDPAGRYKLLDVNPRVWTWHTLCGRAGVEFPHLLWLLASGRSFKKPEARAGISWMHFSSDFPAAIREICAGRLSPKSYIQSLLQVDEPAAMASDDLLPGVLDIPTSAYRCAKRAIQRFAAN